MAEQASGSSGAADPPAADHHRSGEIADEAVARAEAGSQVDEAHTTSSQADSAQTRAAEVLDVYYRTEGGAGNEGGAGSGGAADSEGAEAGPHGTPATPREPGPSPTESGSGGAQNIIGGRISDRVAAGEPRPEGPPFDTSSESSDQPVSGG